MKLSEHLASPSEAALSHLSELNGLRLSPHFSLGELTKTNYVTKDGNFPSRVAIENLTNLCENWLEALRQAQGPLIINSGYRSPEVNKFAGGSSTSNHLTGCAVDIRVAGFEQAVMYASILLDISEGTQRDYDELFIEKKEVGLHQGLNLISLQMHPSVARVLLFGVRDCPQSKGTVPRANFSI